MEELKKLVDVLERKGKTSATALLNFADNSSLEVRLYQLIKEESYSNEALLVEQLYGSADKQNAYKMLKHRVKRKLHNQLFFLDTENKKIVDDLVSVELKCRRHLYLADILRKLQETGLAEQLLKKTEQLAGEAGLISYQIDALEQLRIHYSMYGFDTRAFENCAGKLRELYAVYEVEKKADMLYFDIRFYIKLGVEAHSKFLHELEDRLTEVGKYWQITNSNHIFRRYHQLKMYYYELSGEFDSFITYLKDVFMLYEAGKIHPLYFSVSFNKYLLVFALLRAKQFNEGLTEAEHLKPEIEEGSHNWFAHMENYFLLAVHSRNYQKAEAVLTEAISNKYLPEITTFAQERWLLFYKFMHYISGFTLPAYINKKLKHVPQDKKGYNVWRLILDFILELERGQPDLIAREVERIRKFTAKYLLTKEDARTRLFLKLLLVAGREYNDVGNCRRKGAYLYNKLQQAPSVGVAYAETEIVPYEHLWEIILQKMTGAQ